MAHMIEFMDGKASMAYAGETPWHGLGTEVPADITPADMLKAAGLDWRVTPVPAFAEIAGKQVSVGQASWSGLLPRSRKASSFSRVIQ